MIIDKIKITELFEQFNYTVQLNQEENLTIITGPNGYGKTMILNIIYNLFNQRFYFFNNLVFKKIEIQLSNNYKIIITKKIEEIETNQKYEKTSNTIINKEDIGDEKEKIYIQFYKEKEELASFFYNNEEEIEFMQRIARFLPVRQISSFQWIDRRTDRILSIEDVLNEYSDSLPEKYIKDLFLLNSKNEKFNEIIKNTNIHLIKEQRLIRQSSRNRYAEKEAVITNTILEYADELKNKIKNKQSESFLISQEIDSTFPKRLLEKDEILTEKDFNLRFIELKNKQERLTKYGLSSSKQEVPNKYDEENAKVLSVYLKDSEKKISVFDEILTKLELFTNILNERRFSFKSIKIDTNNGFAFYTNKNKPLNLKDLSSGEQHEVVLLYELIFNAKSNTLVLIDEPEISLHITWQNEFLNDLMQIIKLQNIQVLIATHSPQIINEYWDLTVNLEKQVKHERKY